MVNGADAIGIEASHWIGTPVDSAIIPSSVPFARKTPSALLKLPEAMALLTTLKAGDGGFRSVLVLCPALTSRSFLVEGFPRFLDSSHDLATPSTSAYSSEALVIILSTRSGFSFHLGTSGALHSRNLGTLPDCTTHKPQTCVFCELGLVTTPRRSAECIGLRVMNEKGLDVRYESLYLRLGKPSSMPHGSGLCNLLCDAP